MKTSEILLLLLLIVFLIALFFMLDLNQYLSLEVFKAKQTSVETYYQSNPFSTVVIYVGVFVAITALSLPGTALMALVAGAIFGLAGGMVIVPLASSVGATMAFLIGRFFLRDVLQDRFGDYLARVNKGIEREGAFYLFSLRLVPVFPFFIINLLMSVTPIRAVTFFWATLLGMLVATIVYINAGTQLAKIQSLNDILSPSIVVSLSLLGIFPLVAKKTIEYVRT